MAKIFKLDSSKPQTTSVTDRLALFDESTKILTDIVEKPPREAIEILKAKISNSPQNYFLYPVLSAMYLNLEDGIEAKNIIEKGIKLFPQNYILKSHLAEIYIINNENDKAEQIYRNAYENIEDSDYETKSECLNDLADFYLETGNKEKAYKYWELSLVKDPTNNRPLISYIISSNNYNDLKSISTPINDILTFFDIQIGKYFSEYNIKDFEDSDEREEVILHLNDIWDNEVIPNGDELDKLQPKEKIDLFNSIEVDWDEYFDIDDEFDQDDPEDFQETVDYSIYDTVNPDDTMMLPFTLPLLKAVGISKKRIKLLFNKKEEPTDYEEYLTGWALAIIQHLGKELVEKKKALKTKHYNLALEIAKEELEDDEIEVAFADVKDTFQFLNSK